MKRKIWAVTMIGAMILSLAACGADTDMQNNAGNTDDQVTIDLDAKNADTEDQTGSQTDDQTDDQTDVQIEDTQDASSQGADTVDATAANDTDDTATAAEVSAADFEGQWYEEIAGRCTIEITPSGDDAYSISVHWGSSAFESANWEMNAVYNESTGKLEYTDAKYFIITFEDEDNFTEDVIYENGSGEFWITEEGKLGWSSANSDDDGIKGEDGFVKSGL